MKVAIVFPPLRVSRDFIDYPYFADLGAVQAAAVLREAGIEVALVDALGMPGALLEPLEGRDVRLGASVSDVLDRVPECDAVVVGYTPFHRPPSREAMLGEILEALHRAAPARPIVLADLYQSGQHVVDAPSGDILAAYPEVTALLRYEAERDLLSLVRAVVTERPLQPFAQNGADVDDLDALPLPAWDLVDLEAYFAFHASVVARLGRPSWAFPIDGRSAPLVTSRGCPFRCAHCSSNPSTRREGVQVAPKIQRRHGAAYVARALRNLAERGVRRAHVLDELVNVNGAHFEAVLDALAAEKLSFEIPNGLRADYLDRRHLAAMKGHVTTVSVSAESGVQRVVSEVVDKQLDLEAIGRVARDAAIEGVSLLVHFIIGMPGETKRDINATLAFALELFEETGAWPSVQFATPLLGTRLARAAETSGRALPMLDPGPHFQTAPSIETDAFSLEDLRRFKWTFDKRLEAGQGPKKVILNVTYRCNNRCTFCATGTRDQFDGDFERQKELLVKYRRLGVRLLDLDGGEPTLNPNLFSIIRFARAAGYERVNVTTNARMASYSEFAERLVSSGVTSILASIHGADAVTHAQNVGVAEAFDQTCDGVRNMVRIAPKGVELGANVTLTKSNTEALPEIAALVFELGLRWFNIQFLTPFGRATRFVAPDTAEAARITRGVIDSFGDRMKIQVINLPFCFMPGYEAHLMGDLLKLERHMLFVNNDEVNLFEYLRERRVKKPVCETCPHAVFCGGFFELDDVPEPRWLIRREDLVRPIAR